MVLGCAPFIVAPQLATVTPSHRVIDFSVVSRDLAGACEGATQISEHNAPRRPVRTVDYTRLIHPKKRVMSRPKPWPAVLDRDPLRQCVQEAAGAQAGWTSCIDAVEEELTNAFLLHGMV